MALTLRPYQEDIITEARALMRAGHRSMLICSPTGSGKTALTASMLKTASDKGMRSFFNVHRRELIKQSLMAFHNAEVSHGIIANGFPGDLDPNVQITSIQSLARRYHKYKDPQLIIWDECHHIAAGSWSKIFKAYPKAFHVGLTATPERLDGKGLRDWFQVMIKGPSVRWLIDNNYLADYKLFAPSDINLSSVKIQMGDYKKSDLMGVVDKPVITGNAIREYRLKAMGKRNVIFCVSVKHSEHVVAQFNAAGIPAKHVDGETNMFERDRAIKEFADGKIKVLSNVDLFGEGFDLPSIEVATLLRPTQSLSLYLQQVGRALRPSPGKSVAIIFDHVGNVIRHGLPDQDREWSLDGRAKLGRSKSQENHSVKVCDNCFAAQPVGVEKCAHCGHVFDKKPREVEEVEGELEEVDKERLRQNKKVQQARATTLEELEELGRKRGYKHWRRWAKHVFQARQAKINRGI